MQTLRILGPAPPILGLIGLISMFLGERLVPWTKMWLNHQ
ncbi:DUF1427 family protein [Bacillus sp. 3103sda1]|nr:MULTISPECIES: DUF1427 family protein [unclassified Bacillus (in: firmicutes)]MCP1123336.1 DUF1427 family protein [Bacillus sp. 3103sda1]